MRSAREIESVRINSYLLLPHKTFDDILNKTTGDQYSHTKLQHLVEAETGPEAEVGPEVVEGSHEAEPVHGGDLHPDLLVEDEAEHGVGEISLCSFLYCGLSYQTGRQTVGDENTIIQTVLGTKLFNLIYFIQLFN